MSIPYTNKSTISFNFVIGTLLVITIVGSTPSGKLSNILFLDEQNKGTFAFIENNIDKRFTINTEGCMIPNMNPNDMSIRKFFNSGAKLAAPCRNHEHRLLTNNQTHITTVKENYKFYKIHNEAHLSCCYKTFYRPHASFGIPNKNVDDRIKYSDCILFNDTIEVYHEFVNVQCYYGRKEIYNQFFLFAPKKPFTSYRANPFASERSMYNIIIMGIGSVSRQNFYRTIPKTGNKLKNLEAVEMKGYSTVAADTFQNLIAVLLGMNRSEVQSTCWLKSQDTLDSCPYIWERFKDVGYYTALAEDTAKYGAFNTGKFGFRGSPTDYYIYPFIHQSESLIPKPHKKRHMRHHHSKKSEPEPIPACMGDRYYFEVLLNYIENLTTSLKAARLFGLFWETSMSHDNLSTPKKMDDAYVQLLKHLESSGYLESTILIFLSDHGMNIGDVHVSKQGVIEQREPLLYIYTPESFRIEFKLASQNLKLNKDRLTTPFDVHATLIDLLDLNYITDRELSKRSRELYSDKRAISLFLPVPDNRTCQMAGIVKTWCNCYTYVNVTLNNFTKAAGVKHFLTKHLNEPLKTYSQCLELVVVDIIEAYEMVPAYDNNMEWRDYKVIVRAEPGDGIFEALLRYYKKIKNWVLVNAIRRLNANFYNVCVTDDYVKLYCCCA